VVVPLLNASKELSRLYRGIRELSLVEGPYTFEQKSS